MIFPVRRRGLRYAVVATLAVALAPSSATAQTAIQDADDDTRVETARGGDPDQIYFRAGGLDRLRIDGQRIEPLNTGNSIFLGPGAGRDDDLTNNTNAFIGSLAGQRNVTGANNTAIGASALRFNVGNANNTAIGPSALLSLAAGAANNANTAIGPRALDALTAGNSNAAIGTDAGGALVAGAGNLMLGHAAGANKTGGDFNTLLGTGAGNGNAAGSRNVMIGYLAGSAETGSDKLYVANSATATPLIKGDFAAGQLAVNGALDVASPVADALDVATTAAALRVNLDNASNSAFVQLSAGELRLSATQPGTDIRLRTDDGNAYLTSEGDFAVGGTPNTGRAYIEHTASIADPTLVLAEESATGRSRLHFGSDNGGRPAWAFAAAVEGTPSFALNYALNPGVSSIEQPVLFADANQNVGIGTTNLAAGYRLSVGGKLIAEEVQVQLVSSWPDFVFEPDYALPPLSDVEAHIREEGHLPGVPSAAAVEATGGHDLGATQRLLLQKVEELTLYLIAADKELRELREEVRELRGDANGDARE